MSLLVTIENHKNTITSIRIPDADKLYEEFSIEYSSSLNKYNENLKIYLTHLDLISKELKRKKERPFDIINNVNDLNLNSILNAFSGIIGIINKHNDTTNNFATNRDQLKSKLLNHYASSFIIDKSYYENKEKVEFIQNELQIRKQQFEKSMSIIESLEAELKPDIIGAKKLNTYLSRFFPHYNIKLKPISGGFNFFRNDKIASNLSEGEKSLISFCYFIIRLEDSQTSIKDTIIFIDDPVCSLDSNHMHLIFSVIRLEIIEKEHKQFFLTTHNHQFMRLFIDYFDKKRKNKYPCEYYLIESVLISNNGYFESCIRKLPGTLLEFRSEYIYLFSILLQFNNTVNTDYEKLYTIPNILRRILETYLGFIVPDKNGLESKLTEFIVQPNDGIRVFKFINQYSHSGSSDRLLEFPDFGECKIVVDIVINAFKNKASEHIKAIEELENA